MIKYIPQFRKREMIILAIALVFGFFLIVQSRSFRNANEIFIRDMQSNIFQEIKILKEKNENLRKEIVDLEGTLAQLKDQNQALGAIKEQIDKYKKLDGGAPVFGPGISVVLTGNITTPWATDFINELFNSGAQTVSINSIRITNKTIGFDTLPKGQIVLNGSILSSPYVFNAIGDSSTLTKALEMPNGILSRIKSAFKDIKTEITSKEVIHME